MRVGYAIAFLVHASVWNERKSTTLSCCLRPSLFQNSQLETLLSLPSNARLLVDWYTYVALYWRWTCWSGYMLKIRWEESLWSSTKILVCPDAVFFFFFLNLFQVSQNGRIYSFSVEQCPHFAGRHGRRSGESILAPYPDWTVENGCFSVLHSFPLNAFWDLRLGII